MLGAFAACEKEDPFNWDINMDVTQDDATTETPADVPPDVTPDITPDITPDVPVDNPVDNPIEIIPDGTGDSYGIINANFTTTFILNGDMLSDSTYLSSHSDAIAMTPAFTGTYSSGRTIPSASAVMNLALAAHFPAGTYPAMVAVLQQSAADASGTTPANPWVELDFASDNVTPGNYALDIMEGAGGTLVVLNSLGTTYCMLAFAVGGSINVSASSNTTATEGGTITLSGSSIPIYHPSNTPYGDITADLTSMGVTVCPIE